MDCIVTTIYFLVFFFFVIIRTQYCQYTAAPRPSDPAGELSAARPAASKQRMVSAAGGESCLFDCAVHSVGLSSMAEAASKASACSPSVYVYHAPR